ncbi:hypothetical protein, partial [Klebsiella pneumoniae]|uniref:hypothetical protein n=1 Tax=Klebsiella pneumoniae TaxID=573 RepID=UPI0030F4526D
THVFASLHWLPVCFRSDFKILLMVFKALHGLTLDCILDFLTLRKPLCGLRSSGKADRAFAFRAPKSK